MLSVLGSNDAVVVVDKIDVAFVFETIGADVVLLVTVAGYT